MKFSIGIPAFKSTYLKECIDSVINQSFKDFEIIVVNDSSPMDIDSIVLSYNGLIRYYKNEINAGGAHVVDNWNKCLSYANGEYFVLMGDDDKLEENYLEEFSLLISKYPDLDVYHCRSTVIDENSNSIMLTQSWPEFESVYDNIWHKRFGNRLHFISDFVYRSSSLKKKGGFYKLPLAWASDDISTYMAIGDKGIAHINKPIFNYRKHSSSISMSGSFKLKMTAIVLQEKWLNDFLKKIPNSEADFTTYNYLRLNLRKSIQIQKVQTMKDSLKNKPLLNIINWFKWRKDFSISIHEIIYSFLTFLKSEIVSRKY